MIRCPKAERSGGTDTVLLSSVLSNKGQLLNYISKNSMQYLSIDIYVTKKQDT